MAAASTGVPAGNAGGRGATVDAYSEAFSVGVRHPGDQMLMYGSPPCSWSRSSMNTTAEPRAVGRRRASNAATLALAAGTSTSGSLMNWLQTTTGRRPVRHPDG